MTNNMQLGKILEAAIFAARKHQGQIRKDQQGSPYITHPLSVAKIILEVGGIDDLQTLIAAILHDTIEDTETTKADVGNNFGEDVLSIVLEVTDDKSLEKIERKRLQVVHAAELSRPAKIIKLGDKLINCQDILNSPPKDWTLKRRRIYIQWGADVVNRLSGTNIPLEDAFDEMFAQAEQQLNFKIQPIETLHQRPWAP